MDLENLCLKNSQMLLSIVDQMEVMTFQMLNQWKSWSESNKKGHMIALGSTADWSPKMWLYPTEKKALRDFCRRYGGAASGGGPNLSPGNGIRITYVAPGMLDLPRQTEKYGEKIAKLDAHYLCGVVEWLIDQPDNVNIYEISMDPVQQ
jgi:NADP-dependent 3-hydroxy acid dehydrogenase YdfG